MKARPTLLLIVILLICATMASAVDVPTGTAFTYQGKLTDSTGVPVRGTADFRLSLWDAAIGGTIKSSTILVDNVNVTAGLFTINPDFGSAPFTGSARWLEIEVRSPAGSGDYSLLGTRQQISPVPYALYALNAAVKNVDTVDGFHATSVPKEDTLLALDSKAKLPISVLPIGAGSGLDADLLDGYHGSFYQDASNLNAGTLLDARLSGTYTRALTFSNALNSFIGNGANLTNLNASNIASGTLADGRLSTNVALLNNTQTFTGVKTFSNISNSFTGSGAGLTNVNADRVDGFHASSTPTANTILPLNASAKFPTSVLPVGAGNGLDADLLDGNHGAFYQSASNLNAGTVSDLRLSSNVALLNTSQIFTTNKYFTGNVGIGTTSALYPLTVENPSNANFSRAIYGLSSGTGAGQQVWGVFGQTNSATTLNAGAGVYGLAGSAIGKSSGVRGESAGSDGIGVLAWANSATGTTYGLKAISDSPSGWAGHFTGRGYFSGNVGIGTNDPTSRLQVASADNSNPTIKAVHTAAGTSDQAAIWGEHNVASGHGIGIKGAGGYMGVFGTGNAGTTGLTSIGVYGAAVGGRSAFGVWGSAEGASNVNYAGFFVGDVYVSGTLFAGSKNFRLDHPLDPENKYLNHVSVEAPEMLNIYSGNAVTDSNGYATVQLPGYFQVANKDVRYQLTVIDDSDDFVQAKVVKEIENNQFVLRTSKPAVKVSWQVTGVRNDKWAQNHAIIVEQDKPASDKGKYLHPELYGKGPEFGIGRLPDAGLSDRK